MLSLISLCKCTSLTLLKANYQLYQLAGRHGRSYKSLTRIHRGFMLFSLEVYCGPVMHTLPQLYTIYTFMLKSIQSLASRYPIFVNNLHFHTNMNEGNASTSHLII